jgi:inner membrane protein
VDTLTHALSGALVAGCVQAPRASRFHLPLGRRMVVGAAAAAFPDIDFALRLWDTLTYLNWHQGPTHSLLLAPVWAYLLAQLFRRVWSARFTWQALFLPALLGILIHIAGDLITAYGTMLFSPFTQERYALGLAFVVDPWLTLPLAAGVAALLALRRRTLAALALACSVGYIGFLGLLREQSLEAARHHAARVGTPQAQATALPQPFSPYNWALVVSGEEARHHAFVRLRERPLGWAHPEGLLPRRIAAAYRPLPDAEWRRYTRFGDTPAERALGWQAWSDDALAPLHRFAALPVLWALERADAQACLSYADLRFKLPEVPPSFVFRACAAPPWQEWRLERVRGAFWID